MLMIELRSAGSKRRRGNSMLIPRSGWHATGDTGVSCQCILAWIVAWLPPVRKKYGAAGRALPHMPLWTLFFLTSTSSLHS